MHMAQLYSHNSRNLIRNITRNAPQTPYMDSFPFRDFWNKAPQAIVSMFSRTGLQLGTRRDSYESGLVGTTMPSKIIHESKALQCDGNEKEMFSKTFLQNTKSMQLPSRLNNACLLSYVLDTCIAMSHWIQLF